MNKLINKKLLLSVTDDYTKTLNVLYKVFKKKDIKLLNEQYYLNKQKTLLYGILTIDRKDYKQPYDSVLIFKTSKNKRQSFTLRNALYVPNCDNLILPEENELFKIKLSSNVEKRIEEGFEECFDDLIYNLIELNEIVGRMKTKMLKDDLVKIALFDLTMSKKLILNCLPSTAFSYFSPKHEEFKLRNVWSLLNVVCLSLNETDFESKFRRLPEIWNFMMKLC